MKKVIIPFLLLCIFFAFDCKEQATKVTEEKEVSFAFSSSGCYITRKMAKEVSTSFDSLLSYSFTDKLIMDFSVLGNCCPDSNRFVVDCKVENDSIFVAVIDTAQNLCRCNCLYMIHVEILRLPLDKYVVRCSLRNEYNIFDPIHLFIVNRKK